MQVLIFEVDGNKYAVENNHIESLIRRQSIKPTPNAPSSVAGITSVRDTVYTVIDLCGVLFNKRAKYSTEQIFILTNKRISYIVDNVESVCELDDDSIILPDSLINYNGKHIIDGFFKHHDDIITLLDFNTINNIQ